MPADRIKQMESLFNQFVQIRAKREGITESEAYFRYAERTKRPYR